MSILMLSSHTALLLVIYHAVLLFKDPENASNQQAQHSKNNSRFTEDKYIVIDLYHQVSDFLNLNNKKWNKKFKRRQGL